MFVIQPDIVPLEINTDGIVHVRGTRVTLATVVEAFNEGATAEEIVQQYPSLELVDVYAVITYYLRWQDEVNIYIRERESKAAMVRKENEARFSPVGIRERLLARKTVKS
jgi:uncharacterized protein (DUF433 family)